MSLAQRCLLLLLLTGGVDRAADGAFDFRAHYGKREVSIPMRDGVHLFTAVYMPKNTSHTYPFLITRTPYSVGSYGPNQFAQFGTELAASGFIFVLQDVRRALHVRRRICRGAS